MTPPIMPSAQVWRMAAPVGRERSGHLAYIQPQQACFDDYLAGKFHAGGANVHLVVAVFAECADSAVKITTRGTKQQPTQSGQHRIAQVAMQNGHRSLANTTAETIAHHQF